MPWGGGTAYDNTLFVHLAEQGGHHGNDDMVLILMGGLTKRLGGGGRSVVLPAMKHTVSELYTSIVGVLGAPVAGDRFGDPIFCKGPLTV